MDINRLSPGEKVAGASGVALILIMFIFDWFGVEGFGANAWEVFGLIDLILFVTAAAAIALAVMSANSSSVNLPVAPSAIVAGLGILSAVLVAYRIIDPPGGGAASVGGISIEVEIGRSIGVFLGLFATAGIAYGGWTAMQEEGTSFGEQADRLQS